MWGTSFSIFTALLAFFFFLQKRRKWAGKYSKEGILKWHSSCHGSTVDSTSSCQELWKEGWFLSVGLQLPWLVLWWPAGWYQGPSILISKSCTPREPNDWLAAFIVLQGGKATRKWTWEKSPWAKKSGFGTILTPYCRNWSILIGLQSNGSEPVSSLGRRAVPGI